jgi:Eukaryotic initiation factor 4E
MEDIKRVISFDSVEEFWGYVHPAKGLMINIDVLFNSLYNNIVPPSQLPQKANYYLFKVRGSANAMYESRITTWETGRDHSRLGRRGEQSWRKMEYTTSQGEE